MKEIILQFLLNHFLAIVIMAAAIFRVRIFELWNKCVNFGCAASEALVTLVFALAVSCVTVLSAMGVLGGFALGEYAVSRFLPVVFLMILAFAIISRLLYGCFMSVLCVINKVRGATEKVFSRECALMGDFSKPRFVMLQ